MKSNSGRFEKGNIPWSKINKGCYSLPRRTGFKINDNGCWIWQNAKNRLGYGATNDKGKHVLAHRYFYEQKYGNVPDGFELDHLCKNRICVNPEHLEVVSHIVNCQRGDKAKLTAKRVAKILILYGTNNHTYQSLAQLFNVSIATIWRVVNRITWNNIPDPQSVSDEQGQMF